MKDNKFSDHELEVAANTDITALAESFGYTVDHKRRWGVIKEAQHIVIKENNRFYDNYKKVWGDAISFVQAHKNLSFPEAPDC